MTAISRKDKNHLRNIIKSDLDKLNHSYESLVFYCGPNLSGQNVLMPTFKVEHIPQSRNMYELFFVDGIKYHDLDFVEQTEFEWRKPQVYSSWTGIWFSDLEAFCQKLRFKKEFLHKTISDVFHDDPETIFRNFIYLDEGKFELMKRWSSYTPETKDLVYEGWEHIKDMLKLEPTPEVVKIKFCTEVEFDIRDWKLNRLLND